MPVDRRRTAIDRSLALTARILNVGTIFVLAPLVLSIVFGMVFLIF